MDKGLRIKSNKGRLALVRQILDQIHDADKRYQLVKSLPMLQSVSRCDKPDILRLTARVFMELSSLDDVLSGSDYHLELAAKSIVNLCKSYDPETQIYCAQALSSLSRNETFMAEFVEANGFICLVAMLKSDRPEVVEEACVVFSNMSIKEESVLRMCLIWAAKPLSKLLMSPHLSVRVEAAFAVSRLCANDKMAEEFYEYKVFDKISELLMSHELEIRRGAASIAAKMSMHTFIRLAFFTDQLVADLFPLFLDPDSDIHSSMEFCLDKLSLEEEFKIELRRHASDDVLRAIISSPMSALVRKEALQVALEERNLFSGGHLSWVQSILRDLIGLLSSSLPGVSLLAVKTLRICSERAELRREIARNRVSQPAMALLTSRNAGGALEEDNFLPAAHLLCNLFKHPANVPTLFDELGLDHVFELLSTNNPQFIELASKTLLPLCEEASIRAEVWRRGTPRILRIFLRTDVFALHQSALLCLVALTKTADLCLALIREEGLFEDLLSNAVHLCGLEDVKGVGSSTPRPILQTQVSASLGDVGRYRKRLVKQTTTEDLRNGTTRGTLMLQSAPSSSSSSSHHPSHSDSSGRSGSLPHSASADPTMTVLRQASFSRSVLFELGSGTDGAASSSNTVAPSSASTGTSATPLGRVPSSKVISHFHSQQQAHEHPPEPFFHFWSSDEKEALSLLLLDIFKNVLVNDLSSTKVNPRAKKLALMEFFFQVLMHRGRSSQRRRALRTVYGVTTRDAGLVKEVAHQSDDRLLVFLSIFMEPQYLLLAEELQDMLLEGSQDSSRTGSGKPDATVEILEMCQRILRILEITDPIARRLFRSHPELNISSLEELQTLLDKPVRPQRRLSHAELRALPQSKSHYYDPEELHQSRQRQKEVEAAPVTGIEAVELSAGNVRTQLEIRRNYALQYRKKHQKLFEKGEVMLEQKISRKPEKLMPGQSTMKDLYTNTQQWAERIESQYYSKSRGPLPSTKVGFEHLFFKKPTSTMELFSGGDRKGRSMESRSPVRPNSAPSSSQGGVASSRRRPMSASSSSISRSGSRTSSALAAAQMTSRRRRPNTAPIRRSTAMVPPSRRTPTSLVGPDAGSPAHLNRAQSPGESSFSSGGSDTGIFVTAQASKTKATGARANTATHRLPAAESPVGRTRPQSAMSMSSTSSRRVVQVNPVPVYTQDEVSSAKKDLHGRPRSALRQARSRRESVPSN